MLAFTLYLNRISPLQSDTGYLGFLPRAHPLPTFRRVEQRAVMKSLLRDLDPFSSCEAERESRMT